MNKRFLLWMQRILIALDLIILFLVFFLAKKTWLNDTLQYEYLVFFYIIWIIIAWQGGIYAEKSLVSFELFFKRTIKIYFIWFIFLNLYLLALYLYDPDELTSGSPVEKLIRIVLIIMIPVVALLVKIFIYEKTKTYFKEKGLLKRIMIIGYNSTSKKLVSYFEQDDINTEILGFAENEQNVKELSNYPIISNIDSSVEVAKQHHVDEIYSTITPDQNPTLYQLIHQADHECIRFRIVPDFSVFIQGPFYVSYFNDMPILTLRS